VLELFSPATVGLFSSANDDPCSGATPAATQAQCVLAGVPAALYGTVDPSPAGQYNQRTAGFTGLSPETSDSYTLGLVLTPRFLPRFNASVDFYSIKIKDVIGTFGADFTLTQCVQSGNPTFCNRIVRSADGSLFTGNSYVDNPNANLGAYKTSGIDINAGYRTPLGPLGNLSLDLVGTYLRKFETTPLPDDITVGKYDCAGFFGDTCGTPLPVWRHKARATLAINKNVSISTAWRYFSGVDNDLESGNPLLGGGDGTSVDGGVTPRIKAQSYFDLALVANIDKLTWRLGAQNLFDRQPPISPGYSNNGSNTFAQVYDSLGRYIYTSVTLDF
jgi:outer membrane receptor protein involved in Fe transport